MRKSFSIHNDYYKAIKKLTDAQRADLLLALTHWAGGDEAVKLDAVSDMLFNLMKDQIERISSANAANGAKGGQARHLKSGEISQAKPNKPTVTVPVSITATDTTGFDFVRYFAERLTMPDGKFKDALIDLERRYPPHLLKEATDIYGRNGGKSYRYLEGILCNLKSAKGSREELREEKYRRIVGDKDAVIDI